MHHDTGVVVDFINAPISVRHAVWPRSVARLADDPWAAALVAQHAVSVYDRFRADAAWHSFFTEMDATRDSLLRAIGMPLENLVADYAFVRLADLISLTFCLGWTDEQPLSSRRTRSTASGFRSKLQQRKSPINRISQTRNCATQ